MMGGSESVDYLAPAGSGENTLVTCERGDYAADLEIAHGVPRAPSFPERLDAPAEVETPGITTCEALADFLGIDVAATSKAMPVVADGKVVLALVRGDDRLDEGKLAAVLGSRRPAGRRRRDQGGVRRRSRLARACRVRRRRRARRGAPDGAVRRRREPHRLPPARRGARTRLRRRARRHPPRARGRHVSALRRRPALPDGDRGRPHLQARRGLLGAARRHVPRRAVGRASARDGVLRDRTGPRAGGVVEQRTTSAASSGPASVAPYDAHVLSLAGGSDEVATLAAGVADELSAAGRDVLLDDRDARPGEKFADADLLGCPLRVTVGKKSLDDGSVDLRRRPDTEDTRVPRASVIDWIPED